jgi:hypothetical protein
VEQDFEFTLDLISKDDSIIKLENVKIGEIFQRIKISKPDFPHSEGLINQYIEDMKQQKINEIKIFFVPDMKFKMKDWYRLVSTRIK